MLWLSLSLTSTSMQRRRSECTQEETGGVIPEHRSECGTFFRSGTHLVVSMGSTISLYGDSDRRYQQSFRFVHITNRNLIQTYPKRTA